MVMPRNGVRGTDHTLLPSLIPLRLDPQVQKAILTSIGQKMNLNPSKPQRRVRI